MIHSTYIKIIDAQQATMYNIDKNTKLIYLKKNAAIWYNEICKSKQLRPKYYVHPDLC